MNSARWLKHPHNCRYVVCTWACWAVKKRSLGAVTYFDALLHLRVWRLSLPFFSGEHWSSIMTFVGKKLSLHNGRPCLVPYLLSGLRNTGAECVQRGGVILFLLQGKSGCFFVTESGQKPHYTEMIYKQINFVCSRMVSQNYSSSTEETGTKLVCVANTTPN